MFQYPRLLLYKVAHPRDKRLVAHNGGAVYLLSNVPRKPAASRSSRRGGDVHVCRPGDVSVINFYGVHEYVGGRVRNRQL